ncbi:hypothetical protein ACFYUJ_39145 [Streptomyces sp. NPDC004520]|uniref:hypothetical protein n=1 Tax=Streptomyces sp. NPDC004520 TaxID=3364702 RepID=UPI00369EAE15
MSGGTDVQHSPSSAPKPDRHTGVLPVQRAARADLQELFLQLSPRLSLRIDTKSPTGKWRHKYIERPLPRRAPRGPYAIYLSSVFRRYRWLCFDLDDKKGDPLVDLATLLRWLEEAGLTYVVAASGSAGGRHVWVAAETLLEASLVESIAVAAAKRLPTLDWGLLKSRTGAARPIGAPHRNGGRSELLAPLSPARATKLLTPATCGNNLDAFVRLLLIIELVPALIDIRPKVVGRDEFGEVVRDSDGPRLAGTPRTLLDRETMALLTRRPPADRVSEVCASLLTRLALRRWKLPMVERLLDERKYREGGLLHLCTIPGVGSLRVTLDQTAINEKLARQWARCVNYASRLPRSEDELQHSETTAETVALVWALQEAADACPERWSTESGPADRAALDLLCLFALRSGSTVLNLDVRRAALATGYGRSTMHRAFGRLTLDSWLTKATDEGPAGTYELLPLTASHPAFPFRAGGGTQRNLPPRGEQRTPLLTLLEQRLAAGQADVFAHGRATATHSGGLGHHAGRIYQQLTEQSDRALDVAELTQRTGYRSRTVARHLDRMRNLMVVTRAVMTVHHECPTCQAAPGERCRTAAGSVLRRRGADQHATRQHLATERSSTPYHRARPGSLIAAAKALGTHGRLAARARRYAVETELHRWWRQEEQWMHAPKKGLRTGVQTHQEQAVLILSTLARQPRRRYPRTADGRADHATARARVERRIATA